MSKKKDKKKKSAPTENKPLLHQKRVDQFIELCHVKAGQKFRLANHDPDWAGDPKVPKEQRKKLAQELLSEDLGELSASQELLYASDTWSLLVVFQAMDAAGKDSTISHVMSGVNPQGCQVYSFKQPSTEELDHDFLWRCAKALPERGRIGIFNRSYYEEVLVVRVHPDYLAAQRIPNAQPGKQLWEERFESINNWERHLVRNGTAIIKFFLNVSREEQSQRFMERIENPEKHWKFSASDLKERFLWDEYMQAYEAMIAATSTEWAPWYVIPADNKWVTRALTANIITETLKKLNLSYPVVTPEQEASIQQARAALLKE